MYAGSGYCGVPCLGLGLHRGRCQHTAATAKRRRGGSLGSLPFAHNVMYMQLQTLKQKRE